MTATDTPSLTSSTDQSSPGLVAAGEQPAALHAATGMLAPAAAPRASARTLAFIIPAYDEAPNISPVIRTALATKLGPVLVVDDASTDGTATVARAAGADVLKHTENLGKGGALASGAEALTQDVVVLLDADLVGLKPDQIRKLAQPVMAGEAEMTRGCFTGGRWRTTAAQQLAPQLSGQRAILREALLDVPGLVESRYGVEVAITRAANDQEWRVIEVPLPGVSQVMKEEKMGSWGGLLARLKMYRDVLVTLLTRNRQQGEQEPREDGDK